MEDAGSRIQGENLTCFIPVRVSTAEYVHHIIVKNVGVEDRVTRNVAGGFDLSPLESAGVEGENGVNRVSRTAAWLTSPYKYLTLDRLGDKSLSNWPLSR